VSTPVLVSKLYAPTSRERLVPRERLLRAIDTLLEPGQRCALVSAPAGFGKTTLVSSWASAAAQDPDRCLAIAWVSLDEADNDLSRLMAHICAALERAGVPVDPRSVGGALDVAGATAILTAVMNRVSDTAGDSPTTASDIDRDGADRAHGDRRWLLVLDDYHVVTAAEVHETLTYLVDHLPEQLRLLISTRSDPPLPVARLRARGQLTELRAGDLRVTHEDAGLFLNQVMGLDLHPGDVAAVDDRTEGWAAGLQLAGLSLRGRTGAGDVSAFIEAFTGSNRYVLDYLVDEVLTQQPDTVRDFLLRTSLLDRLTGGLCDAVTGQGGSAQMLDRLNRNNLFLVPLDDEGVWYRYHHLFADVLRARLRATHPDSVADLHRAASDWYADHNSSEDAVRHAFAAEDFNRAGRLVETALAPMRRQRRDGLLLAWLRALPEDVVRPNPVLSMSVGWAALVAGDLHEMERRLDDADRAMTAAADDPAVAESWVDTEDLRAAPAGIELYRAALAQARGDSDGTAAHARAALALAGPEDHFIRGGGAGFLGLAAWAKGDITEALPTFEQSVTALRAAGNHVDTLDSTIVLADMWVTAGRPSQARAICEHALRIATAHGEPYPRATADLHTQLAALALRINNLTEAEEHLAEGAALADRGFITENQHRWPIVMAQVYAAQDDYPRAWDLLNEAADRYRPGFYPDLHPLEATRARIQLASDDLDAAASWAARLDLRFDDEPEFLREYEHLTVVRLHLSLHRRAQHHRLTSAGVETPADLMVVSTLLHRLESAAVATGRHGSVFEIRMLQALTQDALGDVPSAVSTLAHAVHQAPEFEPCAGVFLSEQQAMKTLLETATKLTDPSTAQALTGLTRRLVRDRPTANATAVVADGSASTGTPDPLSEREQEVLRLLASDLTGPQIARQLFISLNTLRTHTKRIFTKLNVTSRAAAVRRGRQLGLLS
jgi:LuxR family maltose regulon positive regulatory protein